MKKYFETFDETIEAARKLQKETPNSYIQQSSTICDCGESLACFVVDNDTNKDIGTFIECEACFNEYEG